MRHFKIIFFCFVLIGLNLLSIDTLASNYATQRLDHIRWRKNLNPQSKDGYVVYKNTMLCHTREQFTFAYNDIMTSNNGVYTRKSAKKYKGCYAIKGWAVARVVKTYNNSNVVMIEFISPFSDNRSVWRKHTLLSNIKTFKQHQESLVR
jgi:hypothetical protein